jgi:hypothetical protein
MRVQDAGSRLPRVFASETRRRGLVRVLSGRLHVDTWGTHAQTGRTTGQRTGRGLAPCCSDSGGSHCGSQLRTHRAQLLDATRTKQWWPSSNRYESVHEERISNGTNETAGELRIRMRRLAWMHRAKDCTFTNRRTLVRTKRTHFCCRDISIFSIAADQSRRLPPIPAARQPCELAERPERRLQVKTTLRERHHGGSNFWTIDQAGRTLGHSPCCPQGRDCPPHDFKTRHGDSR